MGKRITHKDRFASAFVERVGKHSDAYTPPDGMILGTRRSGSSKVHIDADDAGRDALCGVSGLDVDPEAVREEDLCGKCLAAWIAEHLPTDAQMVAAAKTRFIHEEGNIEVDDDAKISRADGNPSRGAYVQAWVWVPDEDAEMMQTEEKAKA
jgi:hypothetical protein